jgi:hypothetical protein|tara:strand:+ start:178 stop:315 length:138 start_codon:yes stop_codon:yes gene_type:complete
MLNLSNISIFISIFALMVGIYGYNIVKNYYNKENIIYIPIKNNII